MLKRRLLILLSLILSLGFSVTGGTLAEAVQDNGVEREYYPDGTLRMENRWKNELIVRKRTFYRNGRTMSDYQYKNGVPVRFRTFYENGQLKSLWTAKSGETRHYYEDGSLRAVVPQ